MVELVEAADELVELGGDAGLHAWNAMRET
jgi:hypothetical protein